LVLQSGGIARDGRWRLALASRAARKGLMSEPVPPAPDISSLSFEQALEQLELIVAELESGQTPLERSIEIYERGAALRAHCEARLASARLRVEKIVVGPQGEAVRTEPADFG
jgi:exodeoxyribonuclease VII small subunit